MRKVFEVTVECDDAEEWQITDAAVERAVYDQFYEWSPEVSAVER